MKNNKLLIWIFVLLFVVSTVNATTYYADPVLGNDSNIGDYTHPLKTIGCHMRNIYICPNGDAGLTFATYDTLILKDGLYNESVNALSAVWSSIRMTLEGENKGGATVQCPDCLSTYVFYIGGGLTFKNFNINGQGRTYCIDSLTKGTNITLDGMNCYNSSGGFSRRWSSANGTGYIVKNSIINVTNSASIYDDILNLEKESNIIIENNTFIFKDDLADYSSRYFVYIYEDDYTGDSIVSITNNTFNGRGNIAPNNDAILKDNIFNGHVGFNSYELYNNVVVNNTFNWANKGANFYDIDMLETVKFENEIISFENASGNFLYFYNVSNVLINNVSCGSLSSPCYSNAADSSSLIVFNGGVDENFNEDIIITNCSFFMNVGSTPISTGYLKDSEISYNDVWVNRTHAAIKSIYPINTDVMYNDIVILTQDISYGLAVGGEAAGLYPNGTWMSTGNRVIGNTVLGPYINDGLGPLHSILFSGMTNSLLENNTVRGGMYNYVIKSMKDSTIKNNYADGGVLYGFLFKGADNMLVENNYAQGGNDTTINPLSIHHSDTTYMVWSRDMIIRDFVVTREDFNVNTNLVYIYANATVKAYDLDYGQDDSRIDVRSGVFAGDDSYLELYYTVSSSGTEDAIINLEDNNSNAYGPYDVNSDNYFLSKNMSDSINTFYPYTITATYGDHVETQTFILDSPKSITFTFSELIPHLQGVKVAVFAGFGLIAVALLAAIAFLITKMFNSGVDMASLTTVSIMAIGLAITLFVGYIIISAVANGLI